MKKLLLAAFVIAAPWWMPVPSALAQPAQVGHPSTIALSDLEAEFGDADSLPQCDEEDCSDMPGQFGLWLDRDKGDWYLSVGEASYLVIDDSVQWRADHNLPPNA